MILETPCSLAVMPEGFYRASRFDDWRIMLIGYLDSRLKRAGMTRNI
jgi:hypothetical protein